MNTSFSFKWIFPTEKGLRFAAGSTWVSFLYTTTTFLCLANIFENTIPSKNSLKFLLENFVSSENNNIKTLKKLVFYTTLLSVFNFAVWWQLKLFNNRIIKKNSLVMKKRLTMMSCLSVENITLSLKEF